MTEKADLVAHWLSGDLATLADLRDRRRVAAAVLFSPWTDLTLAGRSVQEKAQSDVLLDPAKLADAAKAYVGALPLDDPRASPLFGIPRDLPPILIQVGSEEVLLDDARRYAVEARKAGASITLEVWQGMHQDPRELSRRARPRGSLLENWKVTVSVWPENSSRCPQARTHCSLLSAL